MKEKELDFLGFECGLDLINLWGDSQKEAVKKLSEDKEKACPLIFEYIDDFISKNGKLKTTDNGTDVLYLKLNLGDKLYSLGEGYVKNGLYKIRGLVKPLSSNHIYLDAEYFFPHYDKRKEIDPLLRDAAIMIRESGLGNIFILLTYDVNGLIFDNMKFILDCVLGNDVSNCIYDGETDGSMDELSKFI